MTLYQVIHPTTGALFAECHSRAEVRRAEEALLNEEGLRAIVEPIDEDSDERIG